MSWPGSAVLTRLAFAVIVIVIRALRRPGQTAGRLQLAGYRERDHRLVSALQHGVPRLQRARNDLTDRNRKLGN
jgi:hypothetical protein